MCARLLTFFVTSYTPWEMETTKIVASLSNLIAKCWELFLVFPRHSSKASGANVSLPLGLPGHSLIDGSLRVFKVT